MNQAASEQDFVSMLLEWAARAPSDVWLHQPRDGGWVSYTWAQCLDQVSRVASALRATGFPPGSRIAISGRNTAHWYLADLAIQMAGYVPVGLYPRQSGTVTRYIFEHAQIRALFVGPATDLAELLEAVPPGLPRWALPYPEVPALEQSWDALLATYEPYTGYVPPAPEQLCMLIYTSGTSGLPKGVPLSIGSIAFCCSYFMQHVLRPQRFGSGRGRERIFSYLPLAHAFERIVGEGASLLLGAEVYFLESIEAMAATLSHVAPTMFFGVPLVYGRLQAGILAQLPQAKLDRWLRIPGLGAYLKRTIRRKIGLQHAKLCISAAAPIAESLILWFRRLGIEVVQGYGLSECLYISCGLTQADRPGSVGKLLPGADVKLADDGEILARNGSLMSGYYRDEERTREVFTADGYFRTGDRGRLDEDGYLYIIGRTKDIFKTMKGRYVAPAPIEEAIRTSDIESCCLVGPGVPQPILLISLSAAAQRKPRDSVQHELSAAMEKINAGLESHAKIAKCVVVAQPWVVGSDLLTPTMKVKRDQVQQHYAELIARESGNRIPFVWE